MEKVDTDILRSAAPKWSLGGDKRLLDTLQNMHQVRKRFIILEKNI